MQACHNGHVEVVDKLLQYGAKVDLQKVVCTHFNIPQNSLSSSLCFSIFCYPYVSRV